MLELIDYLSRVIPQIDDSHSRFERFNQPGVTTHPIPFFGDLRSARVITVGVNPSSGEFINRRWPAQISASELAHRLTNYFTNAPVPPHRWFDTWQNAMAQIGISYATSAAHVDLSPRATASMGSIADWKGFCEMVDHDARWFFELLPLCRSAQVILMAGCVTKRWYINDFISKIARSYGYRLTGSAESVGEGRVGVHRLIGPGIDLPVFFCSVSPSGFKKNLLVERVTQNHNTILGWLGPQAINVT